MVPVAEFGRYALYVPLGMGGHANVHLGVSRGRDPSPVAIKRLHEQFAHNPKAIARLYDEVRLVRQVQHPNAVRVLELVSDGEDTLAVFEYVHGEPLSRLLRAARDKRGRVPQAIAAAIAYDALLGLHAAHNAKSPDGSPLDLVHRDVGPENILVGADGVARITDFGIAKAEGRMNSTRGGGIRGKLGYLAPEQVGGNVDRRTDVYAVGLTLWKMLTGERPIDGPNEAAIVARALDPRIKPPSAYNREIPAELDAIIMKALAKNPNDRYRSASSFAGALQRGVRIAEPAEVSAWVMSLGGAQLDERWAQLQEMMASEQGSPSGVVPDTLDAAMSSVPHSVAVSLTEGGGVTSARTEGSRSRSTIIAWAACGVALAFAVYGRISTAPAVPVPVLKPVVAEPAPIPSAVAPLPMPMPIPDAPSVSPEPVDVAPAESSALPNKPAPSKPSTNEPSKPKTPAATPKPSSKPAAECTPPTFVDAKGIKRYKPACL